MAIFYNEYQEEFKFPDFFYVEEIGEIYHPSKLKKDYPSLF